MNTPTRLGRAVTALVLRIFTQGLLTVPDLSVVEKRFAAKASEPTVQALGESDAWHQPTRDTCATA